MEKLSKEDFEKLIGIRKAIRHFKKKGLDVDQLLEMANRTDENPEIPLEVFKYEFAPLESVVKYLKENMGFSYRKISKIINRDERTIWKTYDNCIKKSKRKFYIKNSRYKILASKYAETRFSVLEITCRYLMDEHSLSAKEISGFLNKNVQTVWTAIRRYRRKMKNER